MSDEELRKLEKEVRDQDQLLTGYQQENERLYEDLKQAQIMAKTAEAQMFKENQKLGKVWEKLYYIPKHTICLITGTLNLFLVIRK